MEDDPLTEAECLIIILAALIITGSFIYLLHQ